MKKPRLAQIYSRDPANIMNQREGQLQYFFFELTKNLIPYLTI